MRIRRAISARAVSNTRQQRNARITLVKRCAIAAQALSIVGTCTAHRTVRCAEWRRTAALRVCIAKHTRSVSHTKRHGIRPKVAFAKRRAVAGRALRVSGAANTYLTRANRFRDIRRALCIGQALNTIAVRVATRQRRIRAMRIRGTIRTHSIRHTGQ